MAKELPNPEDEQEEKCLSDIRAHGIHIIHVAEDEEGPCFSYSVGMTHTFEQPEVIIMGLRAELSQIILNNLVHDMRAGLILEIDKPYPSILEGYECFFRTVLKSNYKETVTWGRWLYRGDNFETLQLIWPSTDGQYPWDSDATESFKYYQPLLGG